MMNLRLAQPAELVDLGDLSGLASIREVDGALEIGAMVRHQTIADHDFVRTHCPVLAEAAAGIGHLAIRSRGTIGGSVAHADPAAQLPLVAVTLGAQILVQSRRGMRTVPASEFFVSVMTTVLEPDELIVAVRFPMISRGEGQAFRLFARRCGDFAIASVAVSLRLSDGCVSNLLLGVGAVDAVPLRLESLCAQQVGRNPDSAWVCEVAACLAAEISPEDVPRIPGIYRRELAEHLCVQALNAAADRARAGA